jgi:tRNA pseudouridine13 synthase
MSDTRPDGAPPTRRAPTVPPLGPHGAMLPPLELVDEPEAFCVEEIPAYPPSGEGTHAWLRVRKRLRNTRDVADAIAVAAGVHPRDVGVAGQKDKNAVTTQWFSVGGLPRGGPPPSAWQLPPGVEIVEATWHTNKLRVGQVAANRFRLVFSTPDAATAAPPVRAALTALGSAMPNYFGRQRFGRGGANLDAALRWAARCEPLRGHNARFRESLYASVLQSEVFNVYAAWRLADPRPLLAGEVVRLRGSRSVFVVDDPAAEVHRLHSGDISLTGPMFGPKTRQPAGEAAAHEARCVEALGLAADALEFVARRGEGTRRDLCVALGDTGVEVDGPSRLVVTFTLPSGSYATQVVRELTRLPWDAPFRADLDE